MDHGGLWIADHVRKDIQTKVVAGPARTKNGKFPADITFRRAYWARIMNALIPNIRITGPAFVEGRVTCACSFTIGMRHLFHGYPADIFEATPSSRR